MYSRNDARMLMNRLGKLHRPFAFALPYEEEACYVEESGSNGELHYLMPGIRKAPPLPALPPHVEWQPKFVSREEYGHAFSIIRQHLLRGDTYLANLCFTTPVRSNLTPEHFFARAQAPYQMLVPGRFACFSPEAFVCMEGETIRTSPMKGTTASEKGIPALLASEKEQREHATVTDLLRNDLAMVAHHVRVEKYRYLTPIQTHRGRLWATSTDILATLPSDWRHRLGDILFTLLPAGSVTGAPKTWTCRAIAQAETSPRGFYTGIFGHFDGQKLQSAVSIRFVEQAAPGLLHFHSGGGITLLSDPDTEYEELNSKIYVPFAL